MIFTSMEDPPLTEFELSTSKSVSFAKRFFNDKTAAESSSYQSDYETVAALHSRPSILPMSQITSSMHLLVYTLLIIAVGHLILLYVFCVTGNNKSKSKHSKKEEEESANKKKVAWRTSYQATNLLLNLFLGICGLSHYVRLPPMSATSVADRITGFEAESIFAIVQIGYQLWALPIGIFFVDEQASMIGHHVAVLCVAPISAFGTNGFRYHAPFFYGVIELSSVPLSVMNYMRHNAHIRDAYPKNYYTIVRIVFAVTFLMTRVVLWTPQIYDVLRNGLLLTMSCKGIVCTAAAGSFTISSAILTALQYFWALKIVKGISGAFSGAGNNASSEKTTTTTKKRE